MASAAEPRRPAGGRGIGRLGSADTGRPGGEPGGSGADSERAAGERLGIFGGTFDPPHTGHLIVAQDAWRDLGLDRVLFVPAAVPPHKGSVVAPPELRLEMVRAAVAGDPRFDVSTIELRRPGPSYTVDTLMRLRESAPGCALFFLLGADQFRAFDTWRRPELVSELAELVVLSRGGEDRPAGPPGIRYRTLAVTRIDISASGIRQRVAAGHPIRYLVPPGVEAVIEREGVYG